MESLICSRLLTKLNAVPYTITPLPEEMTSFGEDTPPPVETQVDVDYELPRGKWHSIASDAKQANDSRLPDVFVDGAVNSVEIAGSPRDNMGYARSIRAGQFGVGAISLENPGQATIRSHFLFAISTMGFTTGQIESLKADLQNHSRRYELITWEAVSDSYFKTADERELATHDVAIVRNRLRRRVIDFMLEREQDLIQRLAVPVYADGRYGDHQPANAEQFVVGVIKSMRRRYLDISGMQILYNLKLGERTPAFETESRKEKVISFYARVSPPVGGATHALVRVELGKMHFEKIQHQDWSLLDAITAHITALITKDRA
ncbi:MAG: hypothetical protein ACE5I1_12380, partial [bacterium]